jgi:hypothetical protein
MYGNEPGMAPSFLVIGLSYEPTALCGVRVWEKQSLEGLGDSSTYDTSGFGIGKQ